MSKRTIVLVTGNRYKAKIARRAFREHGLNRIVTLRCVALETPEVQDHDVRRVAEFSARWAWERLRVPLLKSDAGCFIEALHGFPGPFLRFVNNMLTASDVLRLLEGKRNRTAYFQDALTYVDAHGKTATFSAKLSGVIAKRPSGRRLGPLDRLFVPKGHAKTLAAMNECEMLGLWVDRRWNELARHLERARSC